MVPLEQSPESSFQGMCAHGEALGGLRPTSHSLKPLCRGFSKFQSHQAGERTGSWRQRSRCRRARDGQGPAALGSAPPPRPLSETLGPHLFLCSISSCSVV